MERNIIKKIADNFLIIGLSEKNELDRLPYIISSWAFYRYLEELDSMKKCDNLLRKINTDWIDLKFFKKFTYKKVNDFVTYADILEKQGADISIKLNKINN